MVSTRSDATALRHPLFWAALALLVVNDHALKGAGVVPGWLTGKLSDFAGLIVAPILLSALLASRTPRRRAIAFVSVAGWFTAVKLIPAAAQLSVGLAGYAGLDWTIAADSTDLIALSVLPLAWHIAAHRGALFAPGVWTERLAVGFGIAACVASPPPEPSWTTAAFLVNRTGRRVEVRVRYVDARVDCAAIRDRFTETLSRDAFMAGTLFAVEPNETLPLDRGIALPPSEDAGVTWGAPTATPTGHAGSCDVAILTAEGMPETVVYWDGLNLTTIPLMVADGSDDARLEGGLELLADGEDGITIEGGPSYQLEAPVDIYDGGAACQDYGAISGFDWSTLPYWSGDDVTLAEVNEGLDGCMSVLIADGANQHNAFICVPAVDFPFTSGNVVQIWNSDSELRILRTLPLEGGGSWRVGELVVRRSEGTFQEGPFDVEVVTVDAECQGVRMECGGFRVPGAGGITLSDGTRYVHPGEAMERDAAGRRARLRIGRAESMWVTRAACGAGRDVLGSRLEALVVYGEETR